MVTKGLRNNLEATPGKHSIDSLKQTAVLGTSHVIRKVLQSENWNTSDGDHSWLKGRSTREKWPVTRDKVIVMTKVIIIIILNYYDYIYHHRHWLQFLQSMGQPTHSVMGILECSVRLCLKLIQRSSTNIKTKRLPMVGPYAHFVTSVMWYGSLHRTAQYTLLQIECEVRFRWEMSRNISP